MRTRRSCDVISATAILRLCRLMCGRAGPFRKILIDFEAAPRILNEAWAPDIFTLPKGRAFPHIRRQSRKMAVALMTSQDRRVRMQIRQSALCGPAAARAGTTLMAQADRFSLEVLHPPGLCGINLRLTL